MASRGWAWCLRSSRSCSQSHAFWRCSSACGAGGRPRGSGLPAHGIEVQPFALVIIFFVLMGSVGVFFASLTYDGFMQQQRCQEWVRTGAYQLTEGTVTDYQYRRAGSSFCVAGLSFDLLEPSAGFTGRFN